jgi:hypothetical protein
MYVNPFKHDGVRKNSSGVEEKRKYGEEMK